MDPEGTANRPSLGAIVDTNSEGRFDLVVFDDGILALHGSYVGVMLLGAGAGMVGAGGSGLGGAVAAGLGTRTSKRATDGYEARRVSRALADGRDMALAADSRNHFIPVTEIRELRLKKRWHGHSLAVVTPAWPEGRIYSWKPALNSFRAVKDLLLATWPELMKLV